MFPVFAELSPTLSQDKIAFRQGDVQALVYKGVHPYYDIKQLMEDTEAYLTGFFSTGMVDLIIANPSLSRQDLKKSTYPSLEEKISTFGTTMTLISSADLDDGIVESLIMALEQNKHLLQAMHPVLSPLPPIKAPQWFGSIKVHKAIGRIA